MRHYLVSSLFFLALVSQSVQAAEVSPRVIVFGKPAALGKGKTAQNWSVNDSELCMQNFARAERANGIPRDVLMAIAATESGRWHDGTQMALPWPWTANAAGKGYYFASKREAIDKVNKLRAQGIKSVDVGCMQVNLIHHPDAFASLEHAFDPAMNVAYAAKFLRANYEDEKDWKKAISAYHSRTSHLGQDYFKIVKKNWQRTMAALSSGNPLAARLLRGGDKYAPPANNSLIASNVAGNNQAQSANMQLASLEPADLERGKIAPSRISEKTISTRFQSPRMRIIQVSDKAGERQQLAQNSPKAETEQNFVVGKNVSNVNVIRPTQNASTIAPDGARKGPKFIFY